MKVRRKVARGVFSVHHEGSETSTQVIRLVDKRLIGLVIVVQS